MANYLKSMNLESTCDVARTYSRFGSCSRICNVENILTLEVSVDTETLLHIGPYGGRSLDRVLNALLGGKVAKLEARVLELEKALQEAAGAFETVEFLATKTDSDSAQTTIGEVACEWADKVFEAATKGEGL